MVNDFHKITWFLQAFDFKKKLSPDIFDATVIIISYKKTDR